MEQIKVYCNVLSDNQETHPILTCTRTLWSTQHVYELWGNFSSKCCVIQANSSP